MSKIVAYLQKLEILEFARNKKLTISDFVEIAISSRKTSKQRRIDERVEMLYEADTLIVLLWKV